MHTPDGIRPIESLAVGDLVYAFDFGTRAVVTQPVAAGYRGSTSSWVEVRLDSGNLRATRRHPVWVESEKCWLDAADLAPGMTVRLLGGQTGRVLEANEMPQPEAQPTFNLAVENSNNFFAGALGILVHNSNGRMNRPGYRNYVLVDRNGRIYYSGMFGPNDTAAGVMRRHGLNNDRFIPANGDRLRLVPGSRTYAESRRLEHEIAVKRQTNIGRNPNTWRGNRQWPMGEGRFRAYYGPNAC